MLAICLGPKLTESVSFNIEFDSLYNSNMFHMMIAYAVIQGLQGSVKEFSSRRGWTFVLSMWVVHAQSVRNGFMHSEVSIVSSSLHLWLGTTHAFFRTTRYPHPLSTEPLNCTNVC